jgi:hypothetical protein
MAHRLGCLSGEAAARRFFYFAQSADACLWQILLQKSQIDGWQFSRQRTKQVEIAD